MIALTYLWLSFKKLFFYQSQNEASEAEAPARRSTRPKKSTPTIPSVGKPSTSRGRRSLPAALLRDGMESDTSVEEPRLSRSSLLVKGTAEQDKKTTNEVSTDNYESTQHLEYLHVDKDVQ